MFQFLLITSILKQFVIVKKIGNNSTGVSNYAFYRVKYILNIALNKIKITRIAW